jgi:hypothetical protein
MPYLTMTLVSSGNWSRRSSAWRRNDVARATSAGTTSRRRASTSARTVACWTRLSEATDPRFRSVLAAHGLTLEPETSEIRELAPYVGAFSARTRQIRRHVDRYEAAWRSEHPGEEPGPRLREAWDRRAWAEARPDKVLPTDGRELHRVNSTPDDINQ